MKTRLALFALAGSLALALAAPALLAQSTNTNALPLDEILRYQAALEQHRCGKNRVEANRGRLRQNKPGIPEGEPTAD
jgi:uncharacterized low-complexity protein